MGNCRVVRNYGQGLYSCDVRNTRDGMYLDVRTSGLQYVTLLPFQILELAAFLIDVAQREQQAERIKKWERQGLG